jgi:DNA mismatch endonuclease (patch repair protein)
VKTKPTSTPVLVAPTRARSLLMARVRRTGTGPEIVLRSALHRAGYRYRVNGGVGLPGTPDIVLPKFRLAIFVDGCFWHGCPQHGTVPKSNTEFWTTKILRNQQRDRQALKALRGCGWSVIRVWEHEIKGGINRVIGRINRCCD